MWGESLFNFKDCLYNQKDIAWKECLEGPSADIKEFKSIPHAGVVARSKRLVQTRSYEYVIGEQFAIVPICFGTKSQRVS